MKIHIAKTPVVLFTVTVTFFIFNSCRKSNNTENSNNVSIEQQKAKIIEATKQRYGNITAPFIINVNQPASSVSYRNTQGQFV